MASWLPTLKKMVPKFSLRCLLLTTSIVGVGIGIVAKRCRTYQNAFSAITDHQAVDTVFLISHDGPAWLTCTLCLDCELCHVFFNDSLTDEGLCELLPHLKVFPSLQGMDLEASSISDDGLQYLSQLPQVHSVSLTETGITDAGLEHLRTLDHLESLHLEQTGVTKPAVVALMRALPYCRIYY
jgi:hypothetical protein